MFNVVIIIVPTDDWELLDARTSEGTVTTFSEALYLSIYIHIYI